MGAVAGDDLAPRAREIEGGGAAPPNQPFKISPVTVLASFVLVVVLMLVYAITYHEQRTRQFMQAAAIGKDWTEAEADLRYAGFHIVPELPQRYHAYKVDVLPRHGQLRMALYNLLGRNPNTYKYLQIIPRYRAAIAVDDKGKIFDINRW